MIIGYLADMLVGKYIDGNKIVRVEYDPFIKGQINIITDTVIVVPPCNDRDILFYRLREESTNDNKTTKENTRY